MSGCKNKNPLDILQLHTHPILCTDVVLMGIALINHWLYGAGNLFKSKKQSWQTICHSILNEKKTWLTIRLRA